MPTASTTRRSEFKEVRLLGEGNFSVVRAAKHRLDGVEYAIKRSTKDITDAASKKQWVQVWIHLLCSLACSRCCHPVCIFV